MSRFVEFQIAHGGPLSYPFTGDRIVVNRQQLIAANPIRIEGHHAVCLLFLGGGVTVPVMGFLEDVLQKLEGAE